MRLRNIPGAKDAILDCEWVIDEPVRFKGKWNVDFGVKRPLLLEVGMGGNLDATNIIKNTLLAVLVSNSMDHMSFLGITLAQKEEKKAGIINDGCRVVTARQKQEAM